MKRILTLALSLCFILITTYSVPTAGASETPENKKVLRKEQVNDITVARVSKPQSQEDDSHINNPDGYDLLMYALCKDARMAYMGKHENCVPIRRGE
ncbi:MAG: hypothetical protein A2131_00040 [Candidatus Sungbacteria bacterium GWC2_49_10]|uniref:Uncharacterized protein n=2 Tax=Parcubacteria group TaxID=1794811 RepID=A0A0G1M5J9_9BACT|nr:MAG: hypothetical protein UV72_C0022G0001 [Candidatus Giovannonibacteria bacterium GW2011_GWB1_43_13]KKU03559.1 MAG: hypothetical protein UX06_C0041G0001 [Candidatus Giovannonibacteria bacterium GW2011_GWA2_45_21]OGZ94153.1 MAG: hypothetical protein A2131_00040 [Candidatus Sungbacteria bacterium GWC2_49_10]